MAAIEWITCESAKAAAALATDSLLEAVEYAVKTKGRADIVVTGGTLGIAMLENLAKDTTQRLTAEQQSALHLWWGDERFVGRDADERNSAQAIAAWGDALAGATLHLVGEPSSPVAAERELSEAAASYARDLEAVAKFDIVFLGMGPDGHIASLFPGHPQVLDRSSSVHPEPDSPKPPALRVTMSADRLRQSSRIVLLFAGEEKYDAARSLISGARIEQTRQHSSVRYGADASERVHVPDFSDADYLATPARAALVDGAIVLTDVSAGELSCTFGATLA